MREKQRQKLNSGEWFHHNTLSPAMSFERCCDSGDVWRHNAAEWLWEIVRAVWRHLRSAASRTSVFRRDVLTWRWRHSVAPQSCNFLSLFSGQYKQFYLPFISNGSNSHGFPLASSWRHTRSFRSRVSAVVSITMPLDCPSIVLTPDQPTSHPVTLDSFSKPPSQRSPLARLSTLLWPPLTGCRRNDPTIGVNNPVKTVMTCPLCL